MRCAGDTIARETPWLSYREASACVWRQAYEVEVMHQQLAWQSAADGDVDALPATMATLRATYVAVLEGVGPACILCALLVFLLRNESNNRLKPGVVINI